MDISLKFEEIPLDVSLKYLVHNNGTDIQKTWKHISA